MLDNIRKYAINNNIPIFNKETEDFIVDIIKKNNIKSILEIGSAIGYSALVMASVNPDIRITTIERDRERYLIAVDNFKQYNNKQIDIINADALIYDLSSDNKYDLLFIDAAKAQYRKFFEKYIINLKENGIIIVDNIDFHGFVSGTRQTNNRNTKQLVRKIKAFNDWIIQNPEWDVKYYTLGDGVYVIRRHII